MSESKVYTAIKENGWSTDGGNLTFDVYRSMPGKTLIRKDGYEIFFKGGGGFEFCIKDPKTTETRVVIDSEDLIHESLPAYEPFVEWLLRNAEQVVSEYQNNA